MNFVSYAQNFEDVMLYRALKHIKRGFYIDVGAAWPDQHSVTNAFYSRGWSGINMEPNPDFFEKLKSQRSRDINLQVGVSDKSGLAQMFFINNTGLSSLDEEIASSHQSAGYEAQAFEVKLMTLQEICNQYAKERDIHFLKVDVEGYEKQVLLGANWQKFRPWIVVVEATLPLSSVENYEPFEKILLEQNYEFVYADGLNRFYLAVEHLELAPNFKYPPNVFDEYDLFEVYSLKERLANEIQRSKETLWATDVKVHAALTDAHQAHLSARDAHLRLQEAYEKVNAMQASEHQAGLIIKDLHAQISAIVSSRSWKLTKPLRAFGGIIRLVKSRLMFKTPELLDQKQNSSTNSSTKEAIINSMSIDKKIDDKTDDKTFLSAYEQKIKNKLKRLLGSQGVN